MRDSRLTRIAAAVADAELETGLVLQRLIIGDALREWQEFAEEFPVSDDGVGVVTVRLTAALKAARVGDWRATAEALRLAAIEIQVVANR